MKIRLTFLLAAVLLVVAACAPSQELRNEQYLIDDSLTQSGTDCDAPCWRGITPGETAWSSAITILEDQEDITDVRVESNEESGELALTFQRRDGIPCCLLYSTDGQVVNQMLLQLAPTNTLGQVIDALGEPAYFNGTEVDEAQAAAALFYPDLGLVVYAFVPGTEGELTADSEVFAALYLATDDMAEVIGTSTLQAFDGYKPFNDYLSDAPVLTPIPEGEAPADDTAEEAAPAETEEEPEAEVTPGEDMTATPTP